jgi:hypothetical protein
LIIGEEDPTKSGEKKPEGGGKSKVPEWIIHYQPIN